MTPEAAATEILNGYNKRRPFNPIGRAARLAWRLNRIAPSLFQHQMEKRIAPR